MSQAEIFQEASELRAKLAASEAHVATLRVALEAFSLWMEKHHECDHSRASCADIKCLGAEWKHARAALAAKPADALAMVREQAGRERAAKELEEVANLVRQTTPPYRENDDGYDRGKCEGRYLAIEQIEARAAELRGGK